MNSSTYRRPGAFSPRPPSSPGPFQGRSQSTDTSASDSSNSSQITSLSVNNRSPHPQQSPFVRPPILPTGSSNASSTSVNTFSRPSITHASSELPLRRNSPFASDLQRHKRQHSQGFFEPSLPTATLADQAMMTNLTASQIAAQAAMQHQASNQHARNRSQTVPSPQAPPETGGGRRKPPPLQPPTETIRKQNRVESPKYQQYHNGLVGGHTAAATAANAAFPRSGQLSPGLTTFEIPFPEKEHKLKSERSKMKLFLKPKQLGTTSSKDQDSKERAMPSPNKMGPSGPSGLSKIVNPSMTSLADSMASGATSIYASNNVSTSTLVPSDRPNANEKEKKHHFLSRQKNKFKDKIADDHALPLSSASSNSRPLDPNAPQSLYSFTPASPGPTTTSFTKSVSGLDLRHGGRALREKKKEEKASAGLPAFDTKRSDVDRTDWGLSTSVGSAAAQSFLGPVASNNVSIMGNPTGLYAGEQMGLQGFGLSNMSPEDAWDFLKAKLLIIFEGEELRMPVEDLNRLVSVHIQRCILRRVPTIIIEDLRDLLQTGFYSLGKNLKGMSDHRLVPALVEMWLFVFGNILPYMQAVFLPLDLEFKGHGPLMTPREAAEFWGANPDSTDDAFGNEFDVRRIILVSYRDNVILHHHDSLQSTFSRLSLDSINASVSLVRNNSDDGMGARPSTAASLDPGLASFNSQGSTLLGDGGRSRATSNLSAPELPPVTSPRFPQHPPLDSSQVTETVGRMLQCVSVLASVQSGDTAQTKMEGLARELKLNWLGRGRTGRNRKGFVGTRVRPHRHGSSQGKTAQVEQSGRESMHML